ncbi:MAG: hypothetical protein IKC32_03805 [Clostridia bacterium]|nr:hypothetical protein [Clostridia bacterium]
MIKSGYPRSASYEVRDAAKEKCGDRSDRKTRRESLFKALCTALIIVGFVCFTALMGEEVGARFSEGLMLAVRRVLPITMPFMLLSSLASQYIYPECLGAPARIFERITGISRSALGAYIIGSVAGFPIGARMTAELYRRGELSPSEAERALALTDNPSIAFILAVVGEGLLKSQSSGFILLISIQAATLVTAALFRGKSCVMTSIVVEKRGKFDLIDAIKSAVSSSINMVGCVALFYGAVGIIGERLGGAASVCLSLFLEVAGGVHAVCALDLPLSVELSLVAFALGFGGFCVMAQVASFASDGGISMRKYLPLKLVEGLLSALFALAGSMILWTFN